MKRLLLSMLLATCIVTSLFSLSVGERKMQVQPFDSEEELAKIDFSKPLAQNQKEWIERATLSLLTVGSGDPLYSWFGHSALIVGQPSGGEVMYDYGVFDPEQKNFYLNFARGRMYYSVWESGAQWRIQEALAENRDVKLIELDISDEAKLAAIRFLQNNAKEENSTYLYHFYYDNCSTRIRDIINAATDGDFETWAKAQGPTSTYRQFIQRYMSHSPLVYWALDFLQSKTIDEPLTLYEEMFLPESLHQAVLAYAPSIVEEEEILQDTRGSAVRFEPHGENVHQDWAFTLAGVILALALFALGRKMPRVTSCIHALILFALGILGSILLFMMLFSDMDMTWFNENILLANPLLFIGMASALGFAFSKKRKGTLAKRTYQLMFVAGIGLLIAKGLLPSLLIQDNMKVILPLLPVALSGATLYGRRERKKK